MNTGLQDAYNLAWKLALVVKGRADPALLDSYEQERIPVAQRLLLKTTDRAFQLLVADKWLAGLMRTRLIGKDRGLRHDRSSARASWHSAPCRRSASSYPRSALSQIARRLRGDAPKAGDRFPWLRLKLSCVGPAHRYLPGAGRPAIQPAGVWA